MLYPAIVRRKSKIQGDGLVATQFIPKGKVVWKLEPDKEEFLTEEEC